MEIANEFNDEARELDGKFAASNTWFNNNPVFSVNYTSNRQYQVVLPKVLLQQKVTILIEAVGNTVGRLNPIALQRIRDLKFDSAAQQIVNFNLLNNLS